VAPALSAAKDLDVGAAHRASCHDPAEPRSDRGGDLLTTPAVQPDPRPIVPDWLAQAASLGWRVLVVVVFGAVVLAAAALLGTVVASVVLAAAVTAAFDPLAARFRASGRSNIATAGLVTLTAAGLALLVLVLVVVAFVPSVVELLRGIKAGVTELENAL
jgi:hypothetical protein